MDELKPDHITALRAYLERGGSVRDVARRSGVSRETIRSWLQRGPPTSIDAWFRVMEAITLPDHTGDRACTAKPRR